MNKDCACSGTTDTPTDQRIFLMVMYLTAAKGWSVSEGTRLCPNSRRVCLALAAFDLNF